MTVKDNALRNPLWARSADERDHTMSWPLAFLLAAIVELLLFALVLSINWSYQPKRDEPPPLVVTLDQPPEEPKKIEPEKPKPKPKPEPETPRPRPITPPPATPAPAPAAPATPVPKPVPSAPVTIEKNGFRRAKVDRIPLTTGLAFALTPDVVLSEVAISSAAVMP